MLYIVCCKSPFYSTDDRCQHILNETLIFVMSCSLVCFTDIYIDLDARLGMRYLYMALLVIAVLSNLGFIGHALNRRAMLYKQRCLNAKVSWARRQQQDYGAQRGASRVAPAPRDAAAERIPTERSLLPAIEEEEGDDDEEVVGRTPTTRALLRKDCRTKE